MATEMLAKPCRDCKQQKPLSEFPKNRKAKDGCTNQCKPCYREYLKIWYEVNKEEWKKHVRDRYGNLCKIDGFQRKYIAGTRKSMLKREYGITPEDYERMLAEQDGVCAICQKTDVVVGRRLAVDHCHKTGKVRGLLCSHCNTAIGRFEDDTDAIQRAIDYLQKHS